MICSILESSQFGFIHYIPGNIQVIIQVMVRTIWEQKRQMPKAKISEVQNLEKLISV